MLRKDKDIVESYEKKNALESLIYNSKEKLSDEAYKYFISNEELEKHMTHLNNEGTWMEE